MQTWQILSIIFGSIIGLYFISTLIYLRLMRRFLKRIELQLNAVDVLLAQKYDVLRLVGKLFKKHKVVLPTEFEDELAPHFDERLKEVTGTERTTIRTYLLKATQAVLFFGEQDKALSANPEYSNLKKPLTEVDKDYRKAVAIYNADVLGYNYWIHVFLWRWAAKASKMKNKDVMA